MPTPPNERRSLEQELAEIPGQITARRAEWATTPAVNKARRQRLVWQIKEREKRLAYVQARLAAIKAETR
jgi:hypothetical protein